MVTNPKPTRSPHQVAVLQERMNIALLKIIRDNFTTQYASQAPSLAEFRDAVSAHHGTKVDATLLADFRTHVPLTGYESYKPFIDKFDVQPCKEQDVVNMFSPGLPDFIAISSGTSGVHLKAFPKYDHNAGLKIPVHPLFEPDHRGPLAAILCSGYRDVKVIERTPGEVVQQIPVCNASGGYMRRNYRWYTDDESRMSLMTPNYAVPWAATVIGHFPSFLIIHGLFFLAQRNLHRFYSTFATQFVDLIRYINEHWDVLVSCIRDGTLPDLEGMDRVRKYLQAHFHPNPERATELREIGPPFSFEGWFTRVWPNAEVLWTICSGSFVTVLPKVRSILGPNVSICNSGYTSSEASIGQMHDINKLDEFVLHVCEIIEFLDISLDATHENICQAWEVEVGKLYEPILTTRDGLWRYQLGDVIHIVGLHRESQSPLFKYVRRRSMTIRFPFAQIAEDQLLSAIQAFSSEDTLEVQEFATVVDDRTLLPTLGFFVELAGPLGPNAHSSSQILFDALIARNNKLQLAFESGKTRLPTIRIVKAGTFAEYRQWVGENANITSGQIKVPVVVVDPKMQEWILEKVIQEL